MSSAAIFSSVGMYMSNFLLEKLFIKKSVCSLFVLMKVEHLHIQNIISTWNCFDLVLSK